MDLQHNLTNFIEAYHILEYASESYNVLMKYMKLCRMLENIREFSQNLWLPADLHDLSGLE